MDCTVYLIMKDNASYAMCDRVSLATMSTTSEWSSSARSGRPTRSQYGSRRMSRVTNDEFDELAFMQQQVRFCKI